jgi:hypothetical protein
MAVVVLQDRCWMRRASSKEIAFLVLFQGQIEIAAVQEHVMATCKIKRSAR